MGLEKLSGIGGALNPLNLLKDPKKLLKGGSILGGTLIATALATEVLKGLKNFLAGDDKKQQPKGIDPNVVQAGGNPYNSGQ